MADNAMMRSETLAAMTALADPALAEGDIWSRLETIHRHGHSLKGLAGLVNAQALRSLGSALEVLVTEAKTWSLEEIRQRIPPLTLMADAWGEIIQKSGQERFAAADAAYEGLRQKLSASQVVHFLPTAPGSPSLVAPPVPNLRPKPKVNLASPAFPAASAEVGVEPSTAQTAEVPNLAPAPVMPPLRRANLTDILPNPTVPSPFQPQLSGSNSSQADGNGANPPQVAPPPLRTKVPHAGSAATSAAAAAEATPAALASGQPSDGPALPVAQTPNFKVKIARPAAAGSALAPEPSAAEGLVAAPSSPALKIKAKKAPVVVAKTLEDELLEYFRQDAEDQVRSMERAVLRWERNEDIPQQIQAIRRAFHTLKGAANSVGLAELGKDFHAAEDHVQAVAGGSKKSTPAFFQFLLNSVDQLRGLMGELKEGNRPKWGHRWADALANLEESNSAASTPDTAAWEDPIDDRDHAGLNAPSDAGQAAGRARQEIQVRVDANQVSSLGNLLSQVVTDRRRVEDRLNQFRALTHSLQERANVLSKTVTNFQKQFEFQLLGQNKPSQASQPQQPSAFEWDSTRSRAMTEEFSELEFDRYDEASILSRSLAEVASDLDQLLGEWSQSLHAMEGDASQFKQTSRQIQDAVSRLTLVAFDELIPRLNRILRDAATAESKEVRIDFFGAETRLDKGLVERVYPSLLHLVRNAVAHGIEAAEARLAAGKEPVGRVQVHCVQASNQVIIRVQDDGSGIPEPKVRAKAVAQGLWTDPEAPLSNVQLLRILCQPGFTTAEQVTDIAGRGVGMDVVASEIEAMNGTLDVSSQLGQGTTWSIRLPLTLSISEGVIVRAGRQYYAIPLNAVLGGLSLQGMEITAAEDGKETVLHQEQALPLLRLSKLLQAGDGALCERALTLSHQGNALVLAVDELVGRSEIPVRPLDSFTACHPLFESGTIDAQGNILPILSAAALHSLTHRPNWLPSDIAERSVRDSGTKGTQRPQILVVDDSVSVRKVQQAMLTSLQCDVITAVDGLDGLEKLRLQAYDLILTDLEMPRLNGYEFIAEIRSNPQWLRVPVIVISSRTTDKHVARAMNLGATSFLFKPFTESQIRLLLDRHIPNR